MMIVMMMEMLHGCDGDCFFVLGMGMAMPDGTLLLYSILFLLFDCLLI